jgi:hypothetical protein
MPLATIRRRASPKALKNAMRACKSWQAANIADEEFFRKKGGGRTPP